MDVSKSEMLYVHPLLWKEWSQHCTFSNALLWAEVKLHTALHFLECPALGRGKSARCTVLFYNALLWAEVKLHTVLHFLECRALGRGKIARCTALF
jgi:hypothetical protein